MERIRPARTARLLVAVGVLAAALAVASTGLAAPPPFYDPGEPASGSTVGPDGALYVVYPVDGKIVRVDPATGHASPYADCLPKRALPTGFSGGMDVAFLGDTAYALVTAVSDPLFDLLGVTPTGSDGIYRIDGPHGCTLVADIGAWSSENLPSGFDIALVTGVQYAMQPWRGGFLVTDGHHNRVLDVGRDGSISELKGFGDVVPTGLDVHGDTIHLAEAGAIGDTDANGNEHGSVVAIDAHSGAVGDVATGASLLVDVEGGRGNTLFALAQGIHTASDAGSPAEPDTGELLRVGGGGFSVVAGGLDLPTSLEIIGNTAYIVGINGDIWRIDDIAGPPYGH